METGITAVVSTRHRVSWILCRVIPRATRASATKTAYKWQRKDVWMKNETLILEALLRIVQSVRPNHPSELTIRILEKKLIDAIKDITTPHP